MSYDRIIEKAEALETEMTALRRDFHKYAETGWFEVKTASIVARKLTELGYDVLTGSICAVHANRTTDEWMEDFAGAQRQMCQIALEASVLLSERYLQR